MVCLVQWLPRRDVLHNCEKITVRAILSLLLAVLGQVTVLDVDKQSAYVRVVMLEDDLLVRARVFDGLLFEALNDFKWNAYAQVRFAIIFGLHLLIYGLLWCLGSPLISLETAFLKVDFSLLIVFSVLFFGQEFRQLMGEGRRYITFYNTIDIVTYGLTLAVDIQGANSAAIPATLYSVAVLFSWIKLMLHLRIIRWLRMALLIDSLSRIVGSLLGFWIVLMLTTFAFAYSLWIQSLDTNALLDTYAADASNALNETETANDVRLLVTYQSVWFFLTGNYSGFQGSKFLYDNILAVIFLITTAVMLMNVLIALISDQVGKSNISEDFQARLQRARVIAQIELYWMLPHERMDPANERQRFPRDLCYLEELGKDWPNPEAEDVKWPKEDWTKVMEKLEATLAKEQPNKEPTGGNESLHSGSQAETSNIPSTDVSSSQQPASPTDGTRENSAEAQQSLDDLPIIKREIATLNDAIAIVTNSLVAVTDTLSRVTAALTDIKQKLNIPEQP
ncbi:hypothetical protein BZG36_02562 [Bifiguratus adelaidae]|uniref:Ion transport domain-containing protein n=1 Tax=Bifiguratus adelaidae TaxID=1938954 RepID=A0A261Y230_9FUNG|nr:hypothetical protein BZG36_02562 [Bifiguratus adelaidae]